MKCLIIACTIVGWVATGALATPINTERGIFCPHGNKHCGHGPACSIHDCDLCPDFPGCGTKVEPRAVFLAKRQLKCPAGLDCDSSDCAIYECNKYPLLRGCGGGLELRSLNVERDGQTVIAEQQCSLVCNNDRCLYIPTQEEEKPNSLEDLKANYRYPCALICGNKRGRCLCARKNTIAIVKKEKRADKIERGHSCPLICDQHGKCGCSKENTPAIVEKEKRAVETDLTHPCLLLCDKNGHCACAKESLSVDTTMKRDPAWIRPCSPICDKNGRCSCAEDSFPVDKTAKRDTATIHPCSLACDKNGHCDCAKEWPSVDKTGERDTEGETGI